MILDIGVAIFSIGKATTGLENRSYHNDSEGNSEQELHISIQRIIQTHEKNST